MKKIITKIFVCFTLVGAGTVANAQAFEEGTVVAAAGYGFPNLGKSLLKGTWGELDSDAKITGFGPIHARFEYGLTDRYGIGVSVNVVGYGAEWSEEGYSYDALGNSVATTYKYSEKISSFNILVRFNKHWDVSDKVDIFSGTGLGYNKLSYKYTSTDPDDTYSDSYTFPIPIGIECTVGVRFYFTENIGAYIEAGWAKSILQAGIAAKF